MIRTDETTPTEQVFLDPTALYDAVERLGLGDYAALIERLRPVFPRLVSDVYALQQIVYKHHLAGDAEYGYAISERLQELLAEVYPVTEDDVLLARSLADEYPHLQPRELLHIAVMRRHNLNTLATSKPDRYRHLRQINLVSIRSLLQPA